MNNYMLTKTLLQNKEVPEMIRACYESDVEHILNVHVTGDKGLTHCINRTVTDLILNDVKVYALYHNKEFVAYFGEECYNGEGCLTGFFIAPNKRKNYKGAFWACVVNHFDANFKIGIYNKNEPAKNFLIKNNCQLIHFNDSSLIFEYKENK